MNTVECFGCAGGMAEGFRRAGIKIDLVFDWDHDACASYEANLGHRPIQMDVRDLLRLLEAGASLGSVDLGIFDPPCTPWSRAGHRKGTADERDMLLVTVEIVRLMRPRCALIANVPGLDDAPNWPTVQTTIGGLTRDGYCVDFTRLDAADFSVPQHRIRPFWFAHPMGTPHITWPLRTHGPPGERNVDLFDALKPWVTCRQALEHLPSSELGSPVRLRWRGQNGKQNGSIPDRPARVVGTSNLSDGNVLTTETEATKKRVRRPSTKPRASSLDAPAGVVTSRENQGDGSVLILPRHPPNGFDEPSRTVRAFSGTTPDKLLTRNGKHPPAELDAPAPTVGAKDRGGQGAQILDWPWERPATTVHSDAGGRLAPPGRHNKTPENDNRGHGPNAIKLSEKAAAILQGFPGEWKFCGETKKARWSMIGQAMPPPLAEAVARQIRRWLEANQ